MGIEALVGKEKAPAVSWYWSYTRLQPEDFSKRKGVSVKGIAWMDHEISSSQLGDGLEGWDWTCMQLKDGTEVKAYRLQTKDGGSDPYLQSIGSTPMEKR